MDTSPTLPRLQLPDSLQSQLIEFRSRLWKVKLTEAICGAAAGVLIAFLVLFAIDRVWDTPPVARLAIFGCGVLACTLVPLALHRWIWGHRRLDQLARLLSRKHPGLGDQMLGIIELVRS